MTDVFVITISNSDLSGFGILDLSTQIQNFVFSNKDDAVKKLLCDLDIAKQQMQSGPYFDPEDNSEEGYYIEEFNEETMKAAICEYDDEGNGYYTTFKIEECTIY